MHQNGLNLKTLRRSRSLTQNQVSYYVGLSIRNYREKECGKIPFSQIEIMRMISLFKLNAEEVYTLFYQKGFSTPFWKNSKFAKNKDQKNE